MGGRRGTDSRKPRGRAPSSQQAAQEETEHLSWCETRIHALGSHTSYLNPLWYTGSLVIGALAGALGDRWSLGFLAATEHQVERHLAGHLERLPATDVKSRAIVEQMKIDEARHATSALEQGGVSLPPPVKHAMQLTSKLMTQTAYWV